MLQYIARRLLLSIPVLFAVLFITFTLGFYGPGDPFIFMLGEEYVADQEVLDRLRHVHGLDRPFWVQFGDYAIGLAVGDWGNSILTDQPVLRQMRKGLVISAQLGAASAVVLIVVGIPLGVLAAMKQNTFVDYWVVLMAITVRSVPVFVMAPMLLIILVLWLDVMNTPVGWDGIFSTKAIIPVLLMAAGPLLVVVRQTRTGVLEVVGQNYVRTARAKGLRERKVVTGHVVKNAMTPVLTVVGAHSQRPDHRRPLRRAHLRTAWVRRPRHLRVPGQGLPGDTRYDGDRCGHHHSIKPPGGHRLWLPGPASAL